MLSLKVYRRGRDVHLYLLQGTADAATGAVTYRGMPRLSAAQQAAVAAVPGAELTAPLKLHTGMPAGQRLWRFPLQRHDAAVAALTAGFAAADDPGAPEVELVPEHVRKVLLRPAGVWPPAEAVASRVPLWSRLRPFQRDGVRFVVSRKGKALVADDMGLGKTWTTMGCLQFYRHARPALIVAPAAVVRAWQDLCTEHLGEVPTVIKNWQSELSPTGLTIVSQGMLTAKKFAAKRDAFRPRLLVLDESHAYASALSQRTKAVHVWAKAAAHVLLLSGTPTNRPVQLYSQVKLLYGWLFPRFFHFNVAFPRSGLITTRTPRDLRDQYWFAARYCGPTVKRLGRRVVHEFKRSENESELHAMLSHQLLLRRTKAQCLPQLPDKTRERIVIDEYHQEQPLEFKNDLEFMQAYRDLGLHKQRHVVEYLTQIVVPELNHDPSLRVLVWVFHRAMGEAVTGALRGKLGDDAAVVHMDGRTTRTVRARHIAAFQDRASPLRVAVLGIQAFNAGVTLTAATLNVFCEMGFTADCHEQAESRAHRLGQTAPVVSRYLIAKDSLDEVLWRIVARKLRNAGRLIDNMAKFWSYETRHTEALRAAADAAADAADAAHGADGADGADAARPAKRVKVSTPPPPDDALEI